MTAPDHKEVSEAVDRVDDVKLRVNLQAVLTASNIGHVLALHELYEQQSAELEKLRQRCGELEADAATERALQRAAKELPEGWIVRVEVERGAGWVDLHDPSGAFSVQGLIDADDTLAAAIHRAIDRAGGGES
jgi:hypothetical protein